MNQSLLRLSANTTITLESVQAERGSVVSLLQGLAHFFSRGPRGLEVRTPFTVAGVRGTEFFIGVETDKTLLTIYEGTVVASNQDGSLTAMPCTGPYTIRRFSMRHRSSCKPGVIGSGW
jgi:hypothetical protein